MRHTENCPVFLLIESTEGFSGVFERSDECQRSLAAYMDFSHKYVKPVWLHLNTNG